MQPTALNHCILHPLDKGRSEESNEAPTADATKDSHDELDISSTVFSISFRPTRIRPYFPPATHVVF